MKENSKTEFVNRVTIVADKEYVQWIAEIKQRFKSCQAKAIIRVNAEMLSFYWSIGRDLVVKKVETVYGKGIMANLSKDLKDAFPEQTGFSIDNLYFMKRWYLFYTQNITIFDQTGQNFEMPIIFKFHFYYFSFLLYRQKKRNKEKLATVPVFCYQFPTFRYTK